MRCDLDRFDSGWVGLYLKLRPDEIEPFVAALRALTSDAHFHLMHEFAERERPSVIDIEISLQGPDETDNLRPTYARRRR